MSRTLLGLCVLSVVTISVAAACGDCQKFQFNGVDDAAVMSQLQVFLAENVENGSTITLETEVKIEKRTPVAKKATMGLWHGWEKAGNRYYKCFSDQKMPYLQAKSHCNIFKGRLAAEVLRDPDVVSNIASICVTQGHHPWIGLDDFESEGQWKWSDGGSTNDFTVRWRHGEPNNGDGYGEDCAQIWAVSRDGDQRQTLDINDQKCSQEFDFICEV